MADNLIAALYALGIGLFMLGIATFAIESQDCERKGGVMMKPAIGWYTCVKPVK